MTSERSKQMWRCGRRKMACLTPEGNELVCYDELVAELGMLVLITMPSVRRISAKLE